MDNSERERLLKKMVKRELTEAESLQIGKEIIADDAFADEARFQIALQNGLRTGRDAKLIDRIKTEEKESQKKRYLKLAGIGAAILFFIALAAYLMGIGQTEKLQLDKEKRLINGVILAGVKAGYLGGIAGPADEWTVMLANGKDHPENIEQAYQLLRKELPTNDDEFCRNLKARFYLGVLELYYRNDPAAATKNLNCITINDGPAFKLESGLPQLILLGLGPEEDVDRFRQSFARSGFPRDTLPAILRTKLPK